MRHGAWITLFALLAACGGDDDGGLDEATSRAVFDAANDEIHALHLAALEEPEWPAEADRDCPDGGSIHMVSEFEGEDFDTLRHAFDACEVDGFVLGGDLDYADVVLCDDDSATYDMIGTLTVDGIGDCVVDAAETCGVVTGSACGHEL